MPARYMHGTCTVLAWYMHDTYTVRAHTCTVHGAYIMHVCYRHDACTVYALYMHSIHFPLRSSVRKTTGKERFKVLCSIRVCTLTMETGQQTAPAVSLS